VWRAPFSALLAELVASPHRSKTEGILGVAMCVGAMLMLGSARSLAARSSDLPFALAAGIVTLVWAVHAFLLREPAHDSDDQQMLTSCAAIAPWRSLRDVFTAESGRATQFFAGCLLFQMAFQSFSSWFTLHGSERFHTTVADVSLGFIAVALATLVGSIPAGWLGARYGRRRMSLVGIAGMALACVVMHLVPTLPAAVGVLFLFGLAWSFPVANLTPMALELGTPARAGSLAGAFLLVQSAAGVIGPSLVGTWFDATGSKRALFVLLASFLAAAFALLATLAKGFGEVSARIPTGHHAPSPIFALDRDDARA
jgi:MFS-type transporter involved in bile tolerance (Atg22 family)